MAKMTLKQQNTIKQLPKNKYNIAKSMRKAGYSESTSKSGQQYERIHKHLKRLDFFDPEQIKRDIKNTRKLAKKKLDISNLNRIDEHRSKIAGMIKDKSEVELKKTSAVPVLTDFFDDN